MPGKRKGIPRSVKVPLADRLAAMSVPEPNSGCILFDGPVMTTGYGVIGRGGRGGQTIGAHRAAWELRHGPIAKGMVVCHKCDVPLCVNADHLFLGTHADNMADMVRKKRHCYGVKNPMSKLTAEQVAEIRAVHGGKAWKNRWGAKEIASQYNVRRAHLSRIVLGQRWKSEPKP